MHQASKVIQLPCNPNAKKLEVIKSSLERSVLLHPQVIENFQLELNKIARSIEKLSPKKEDTKQNELIEKLHGRCHHLKIRKAVIDLAEDAEKLVHNKDNRNTQQIQALANKLQNKIDAFNASHRTSRINAKFLRFANNCIQKARDGHSLIERKLKSKIINFNDFELKEVTEEDYQRAQNLYELAHSLYFDKTSDFKIKLEKFDIQEQKELYFHIYTCKGSLDSFKDKKEKNNTLRAIIGFAHTITDYYTTCSAYPSDHELYHIFEDLKTL